MQPFNPHQGVQLLPGEGEVLAQALVDTDATGDQLVLEHLLEQAGTTATAGAGLGLRLELGQIAATSVDGRTDRALADVVARADHGRLGQGARAQSGRAGRGWQDQAGRFGRQGNAVLGVLQQGVVVAVIAHQHRPQHLLAGGVDHQPAVAGAGFVDELEAARTRGVGMGIADGTDVDAQQLELGRHVRADKGLSVLIAQLRRDTAGHLVARCDQAEQAAIPRGTLANGINVRVAAQAPVVNHHPTARADVQRALASQGILGTDPGGEHDQVGLQAFFVGKVHPVAVLLPGTDRLRGTGQVHTDAQPFDLRLQRQATQFVQLHRHQARGKFHHMGFQAEAFQGIGRLQAQQPPAHHHTAPRIAGGAPDGIEVLEGAVDQARVAFGAVDVRYKGIGTRGQDQGVVGDAALGGDHLAPGTVDFQHRHSQVQGDTRRLVQRRVGQRQ